LWISDGLRGGSVASHLSVPDTQRAGNGWKPLVSPCRPSLVFLLCPLMRIRGAFRYFWPMKQLIETIETLRVRGIGFRSLTEALDTTTAQGRLVFHMFGALTEFERSLIRERTQVGLAAARRLGREGGRRNSPTMTSRPPRRCWPIPISA
jgi:Resolvase, N terminal domain